VSFEEYSLFDRALLQKRPIILRSLLIVATPYRIEDRQWVQQILLLFCTYIIHVFSIATYIRIMYLEYLVRDRKWMQQIFICDRKWMQQIFLR